MEEEIQTKSKTFKVISVLSYIFIGIQLISVLIGFIYGRPTEEKLLDSKIENIQNSKNLGEGFREILIESYEISYQIAIHINPNYFIHLSVSFIMLMLGLIGVVFMNQKKKLGFHFYIIYSLLFTAKDYFFLPKHLISIESVLIMLMISGLFVYLYSRNLKWLK